jgi:menaquinone-dependent protoporphyrinogen oxidase
MSALVVYGSKRGGTQGLAEMVGRTLDDLGHPAEVRPARDVRRGIGDADLVIVGGALYAFRWHRDAAHFVRRYTKELRSVPVWLFSSGPLDDSAKNGTIAPVRGVAKLMQRIGARGHATFGGRLTPDAKGFPASAMAKTKAGDWRDEAEVRRWVESILAGPSTPDDSSVAHPQPGR